MSIVVFHFWFDHAQLVGTKHLVAGGKKCSGYVASLFVPWFTALDPKSTRIDSVFFDGASNVQKAGRLLQAQFPRVHINIVLHIVCPYSSQTSARNCGR